MIRNIVFDLGGVLITYNPETALLSAGYSKEEADRLNHAVFLDPLWRELDRGTYRSMKEALPLFVKAHPQDQALIQSFFSKDWMKILFQPIDESVVFMKKLKQEGYRIYFLTNYAADTYQETSSRLPFFRMADGTVVSADVKLLKPDPRIYQTLLERYHLSPEETVFFDDSEINVQAAIACGIHARTFHSVSDAEEFLNQLQ